MCALYGVVLSMIINMGMDKIMPSLREIMQNTPPDEKIEIIVHLAEVPDFEAIKSLKPKEYVEFLKNFCENSQKEILNYLKNNFKDKISDLTPYWIFNGFYVKATKDVIEAIAKREEVEYIIENFEIPLADVIYSEKENPGTNAIEWNILNVRADSCWMMGYTGQGVIIGHMDTGVDVNHPALAGKWLSPYWYDPVNNQPNPYDDHGHGTHTMGTILGGDGFGPFQYDIGVAPGAKFVTCKICNASGSCPTAAIHAGFQKHAEWKAQGVNIVASSNSWGGAMTSTEFWQDVLNWRNLGIIPVFAIGNEGTSSNRTPGNFPTTIGVGATQSNDYIAPFSSRGPAPNQSPWNNPQYWPRPDWNLTKPNICAPGQGVNSALPGGSYGTMNGTSMATPHVAGAIAILYQKNPQLTFTDVYNLLLDYARRPSHGAPYPNNTYGWGLLNVYQSLLNTPSPGIPESLVVFTPFNFEKTFTRNPLFKMRAVDPQGDNVIYQIVWSLDTLFTSPESINTPPYPSGQIISYNLAVALTQKQTYWFKVRVKDTTSTGSWSQFTPRFSLTVDTTMLSNTCSWYQTKGAQFKYNTFSGTKIEGDSVVLQPYGYVFDTLLSQNFEGGTIPPGWTVIDGNNDGYKWTVGTTADLSGYEPPNYGTRYAYYSDDDAGNGVINYNEELWTPAIGLPSTAANLKFKYGYGFRVFQTGEKYRVHFRKKVAGSWTAWTQLKVYTSSVAGTDSVDLSNQLPCDSIQFRFFYSDSTASSHWGWACACDNVFLIYSYTYQNNEGTMTTAPCVYKNLSLTYPRTNWGYIYWEKSKPQDSIGVQVEYFTGNAWQLVPNSVLPGNSQGFFTSNKIGQVNIINLDTTTYNTIRLKVIFVRKQNAQNPALLWCEIGNPAVSLEELSKNLLKPQILAYPTVFNDKLHIKYLIPPFEKAKIKIYNASGRKIEEITYNPSNTPISGTYVFEGKGISQGIYFIRFETKSYKKTLKTIYVK